MNSMILIRKFTEVIIERDKPVDIINSKNNW